jgi:predicted N-acyltransferase
VNHRTFEIARSIADVSEAEWNALAFRSGHRFAQHRWLRLAEAILRDHEPRYVLLRRDRRLQAAAVCSIGRRFGHSALQRRLGWVLRLSPWLRCSLPLASEPGVLGDLESMSELMRGVRRLAFAERALLVTCANLPGGDARVPELERTGFLPHSRWSDLSLRIEWSSVEQYVAALPGPDRREVGRLRRRAERERITVERLANPLEHAERVRELIANVSEHHGTRDVYVAGFLDQMLAIAGEDVQVLAARRDDTIIGCAITLRDRAHLIGKWIGLDYAQTWGTCTYQLLIFESVRLAIELKADRLGLGATAAGTKRQFGAVAEERVNSLAILAPVPVGLVGAAARLVAGQAAVDPTYSTAPGRTV